MQWQGAASVLGGMSMACALRNASITSASSRLARRSCGTYHIIIRTGNVLAPVASGMRRSLHAAKFHAESMIVAAREKNRRDMLHSRLLRMTSSSITSFAAADMPCPYIGLKLDKASPKTRKPAGNRFRRSYRRRILAGKRVVWGSPSGSAFRITS